MPLDNTVCFSKYVQGSSKVSSLLADKMALLADTKGVRETHHRPHMFLGYTTVIRMAMYVCMYVCTFIVSKKQIRCLKR